MVRRNIQIQSRLPAVPVTYKLMRPCGRTYKKTILRARDSESVKVWQRTFRRRSHTQDKGTQREHPKSRIVEGISQQVRLVARFWVDELVTIWVVFMWPCVGTAVLQLLRNRQPNAKHPIHQMTLHATWSEYPKFLGSKRMNAVLEVTGGSFAQKDHRWGTRQFWAIQCAKAWPGL